MNSEIVEFIYLRVFIVNDKDKHKCFNSRKGDSNFNSVINTNRKLNSKCGETKFKSIST